MASFSRYSNAELVDMPDCGGLMENGKCKWLSVPACLGAGCSYCSSVNDKDSVQKRLQSLDEETQNRIACKYYSGMRPWLDTSRKHRR